MFLSFEKMAAMRGAASLQCKPRHRGGYNIGASKFRGGLMVSCLASKLEAVVMTGTFANTSSRCALGTHPSLHKCRLVCFCNSLMFLSELNQIVARGPSL